MLLISMDSYVNNINILEPYLCMKILIYLLLVICINLIWNYIHKYNINIIKLISKTKIFKSIFTGLYVCVYYFFLPKKLHIYLSLSTLQNVSNLFVCLIVTLQLGIYII